MVETRSSGRAKALLQRREQEALPTLLTKRPDRLRTYFRRREVWSDNIDWETKVISSRNPLSTTPLFLRDLEGLSQILHIHILQSKSSLEDIHFYKFTYRRRQHHTKSEVSSQKVHLTTYVFALLSHTICILSNRCMHSQVYNCSAFHLQIQIT